MLISSVWRANSRWWFSTGLLAGGFTSALVAVAVGILVVRPFVPPPVAIALVGLGFCAVALHELGLVRLRLPQNARQVPESIGDDGDAFGALQFGFEMGTGVRTFMTSALPHLLALGVLLTAGWFEAIAAGIGFGAGRALMTLTRHAHRDDGGWDALLTRHEPAIRIALTAGVAVALLAAMHVY